MPIFSLPSGYGIGTLGAEAYRFVDFLKLAGQSYWQILPLNPTNYGDSPYQSFSSFAGNPYFIDIELLIGEGLLTKAEADDFDFGKNSYKIDYGKLYENRLPLLKIAFSRFKRTTAFDDFCADNAYWLNDYALFMALKSENNFVAWQSFNIGAEYDDCTEDIAKKEEVLFHKFLQFKFFSQWQNLKNYANENGVKIIGDIPIYVALDSADVWSDKAQFLLDGHSPRLVAGCPPDAFTEDGQLWGNPLYDWKKMKADNYGWWKRRLGAALKMYDVVRIDHFRGFEAFYAIPATDKTAKNGKWIKGPDIAFFREMKKEFGEALPIIAEDLGFLTPQVHKMLRLSGFPGMKVLQFAFDSREESDYLPHNYDKNCVVYTGTHDNDTIIGWVDTAPTADVKFAEKYLNCKRDNGFNFAMIRAALSSVADTAIIMMPDLIGAGSDARINTPSTLGDNWQWRIDGSCINDWLANIVHDLTETYSRIPEKAKTP